MMRGLLQRLGHFAGVVLATALLALPVAAQQAAPAPRQVFDTPAGFVGDDWLSGHYRERTVLFADYPPLNGGVAFLGDSITEGGDWASLFPGVETRNYGVSGDRTEGLLVRYSQLVAARPGRIILLIGTNDLSRNVPIETIDGNVARLLDLLKAELPGTQLVVQSVLPRQAEFDTRIRDLNGRLERTAGGRGADFIDIHSAFVVEGDRLDPAVTEDDLHLTPPGYARWAARIDGCVRQGACE
jgi:lysophospholipase L1-like esterase